MSVREPGVHVTFEMYPVVHGVESKSSGREITIDKPHVRIRVAGNDKEEFFGPATDQMKARFPEEWEAFERGNQVARHGTPLERWPQMTPSMVRTLKNLNILTVEDMATLSDAGLQKVGMGAQKLRTDAQRFLSLAQASADLEQMDEIKAQNAALMERLAALEKAAAEKPAKVPRKKREAAES